MARKASTRVASVIPRRIRMLTPTASPFEIWGGMSVEPGTSCPCTPGGGAQHAQHTVQPAVISPGGGTGRRRRRRGSSLLTSAVTKVTSLNSWVTTAA